MPAAVSQPDNVGIRHAGSVHQQLERLGIALAHCRTIAFIKRPYNAV